MSDTRYTARTHLIIGFTALGLLIGGLGLWGATAQLAGAIIATGLVEVESDRQVIEHDEGGIIAKIHVRDGDVVSTGDVLFELDDTLFQSELTTLQGQYFELLARQARLRAESEERNTITWPEQLEDRQQSHSVDLVALRDSQTRLHDIRRGNLNTQAEQLSVQADQLNEQLTGVTAQLEALERQKLLITDEITDTRSLLEKGLARAPQLKALEREAARLDGDIGRLLAERGQIKSRQSELEIARIELFSRRQEEALAELRDIEPQIIDLGTRIASISERLSRLTLKAPVAGIVFGSQVVAEQSVISPAEPLLYIVPDDEPLIISARVDAIHVEQVHQGQEASLRFSTFDQRFTPELFGTVQDLSADVIIDQQTGQQYYEAKLTLIEGEAAKLGDNQLIPGLPVEVFIQTGNRTPIHYLTKPLTDYFARACREN